MKVYWGLLKIETVTITIVSTLFNSKNESIIFPYESILKSMTLLINAVKSFSKQSILKCVLSYYVKRYAKYFVEILH